MSAKIIVNGNNSDSLLFTNVRTTNIRSCKAEIEWEKKIREARETLLAEIRRRTEENKYKI